eukprot:CAMPEP_0204597856 /NCGR_PEP_ID=MMETSP0661-20131031/54021_1 /ASSEMBLY_ACC=CAM_ASM_000606 /TAXON_ID=109239 /ORGANISM="Alexandrium margalefi, Strain AMGDE01CS-322" /LENGTH=124 /DNA_ID=CAMNT_0051608555 /DNA_START=39 /DNA_END=412 /DNA_ORIENTATION=-
MQSLARAFVAAAPRASAQVGGPAGQAALRSAAHAPGPREKMTLDKFVEGPVPAPLAVLIALAVYMNKPTIADGSPRMSSVSIKVFGPTARSDDGGGGADRSRARCTERRCTWTGYLQDGGHGPT